MSHQVFEMGGIPPEVLYESELVRATGRFLTGSTYLFGSGADIDIVVMVPNQKEHKGALLSKGWVLSCETQDEYVGDRFTSYRKGEVNLLLTDNLEYFNLMLVARDACKRLAHMGLLSRDKAHRVSIHLAIQGEVFHAIF